MKHEIGKAMGTVLAALSFTGVLPLAAANIVAPALDAVVTPVVVIAGALAGTVALLACLWRVVES